jgi:hypothetical protein
MKELLSELHALEARANALLELGVDVENKLIDEDRAKLEYKALKQHLARRVRDFERRPPAGVESWVAATFSGALRKAHIEMRTPTSTSPKNQNWRNSVHGACEELSYYAASLAKGLGS